MKSKVDILYVVNHAAFFVSHRLPIALAAKNAGYSVGIITGQAASKTMEFLAAATLDQAGLSCEKVLFKSAGLNPLRELIGLVQLFIKVRRIKPELMHCISPKGIIYGGFVARITKTRGLVLAVSGMGFAFTEGGASSKLRNFLSRIFLLFFKFVLRHPNLRVIVQNEDDRQVVTSNGVLDSNKVILIPGSGVDLGKLIHHEIKEKDQIILLPARMVWDKGIGEFILAARLLKTIFPKWRFILAGAADYQNPTSIPIEFLERLNAEKIVEWVGYVNDMTSYFSKASIVCLPSYREGIPKSLLEAAAAGCAVVTTDAVGCREAILPGITGLLVPVRDSEALKDALKILIEDRGLREGFGKAGRDLAINKFSLDLVKKRTLMIYRELLKYGQ